MKKLKIGFFMDDFYPSINGVVLVMDNYARRLSKIADVVVVVPYTGEYDDSKFPYKVIRVKSHNMHIIDYYFAKPVLDSDVVDELMSEKFDIIHIHSPFVMGYWGVHVSKKLDIPVIATMHTQFKREFKRHTKSNVLTSLFVKIIMDIFNKCYKCYAVSPAVAQIFYDYGAKKMPEVLNNGTELKYIPDNLNTDEKINKMYNLDKDEILLLFVGRINILKNVLFILDTVNELKKRNIKFKMMFVGALEDKDKFENKLNSLKLQDKVIVTGKINDRQLISEIYKRAKLFVFPSISDASSLVQIEAASQKTPTIFLEGTTTASSVTNNVNGFLGPNDYKLFADRIIEILNDKELYNKVSEGAYKDLYKTWDQVAANVYDLYLETIENYNKRND